jgi:hypothetical protein
MNLEFDDSDQVEIHFTQKGLRRGYKGTIGGFFDRHGDATWVEGMKFLFGAEESRSKSEFKDVAATRATAFLYAFNDSWPLEVRTSLHIDHRSLPASRAIPVRLLFHSRGQQFGPPFEL